MSPSHSSSPSPSHTFACYSFPSSEKPYSIAAYSWTVPNPSGRVLLLHGFRSHARFNFLRNGVTSTTATTQSHPSEIEEDPSKSQSQSQSSGSNDATTTTIPSTGDIHHHLYTYESSFISLLNERGFSVYAHDHVGHGSSGGQARGYFSSFQVLVDDVFSHIDLIKATDNNNNKPIFLCAHSMGGTVALTAALQRPALLNGAVLSSAATEPPANMFGFQGQINYLLSGVTSMLIPMTVVVNLPKSDNARLQYLFEHDPLNISHVGVRARVGRELIMAYGEINERAREVQTPFCTAAGERDTLVNPKAALRFYNRAGTKKEDKLYFQAKGRWHNLLVEDGYEEIFDLFANWLTERVNMSQTDTLCDNKDKQ